MVLQLRILRQVIASVFMGVLSITSSFTVEWGDTLMFVSALLFAGQIVSVGKFASDIDPYVLAMIQIVVTGIGCTICAFIFQPIPKVIFSLNVWGSIAYGVIFGTMLAFILQSKAQQITTSSITAIILCFEAVFALFFALALGLETLSLKGIIGSVLAFVGFIICEIDLGILPRGSNVLVEKPSYLNSVQLFQSMGFRLTGIPMDREGVEIKDLENYKRINHGSVLFTIPSFHNPTGKVMSLKRRSELLEVCSQQQLPIIEDDAYQDLWLDTPLHPPLKAMDKNGIVVYLGTTSKHLEPGLRIGWVVGPEPIIERMADIKVQADNGSSSLSKWAVAEWIPPSGGFYIWIKLNKRIPYSKLFSKILERGVLVNPCCIYGADSQTFLRLSYSYASLTDIKRGIEIISSVIRNFYRYN